jgi:hypothetical protein
VNKLSLGTNLCLNAQMLGHAAVAHPKKDGIATCFTVERFAVHSLIQRPPQSLIPLGL